MEKTSPSLIQNMRNIVFKYGPRTWLLLGIYILLCGFILVEDTSIYHRLFYILFIPPTIILLTQRNHFRIVSNPIVFLYLVFILVSFISTLVSTPAALSNMSTRAGYIFALFATASLAFTQSTRYSSYAALMAGFTVLLASLYNFVPWLSDLIKIGDFGSRFIGPGSLDNPLLSSHIFGFYTVLFALTAIYTNKKGLTFASCIAAICFLLITLSTGSRTPLLALAVTVLWLPLINPNSKTIAALLGLCTAFAITYAFIPELLLNRGLSYRPELWSMALEKIKEAPLLGYGFDAEPSLYVAKLGTAFREPHNMHLSILYFTGFLGFAFWTGMHVAALVACIKNKEKPIFVLASCLLVYGVVAGMTEGGGLLPRPKEHWFITWIPLALIAALSYSQQQRVVKKSSTEDNSLL